MNVIEKTWLSDALTAAPTLRMLDVNDRQPGVTPLYFFRPPEAEKLWALNIYAAAGEIHCPDGGGRFTFEKGDCAILPGTVSRQFLFKERGAQQVALFEFQNPPPAPHAPVIIPCSGQSRLLSELFHEMHGYYLAGNPSRSDCLLWQLLWRVSDALVATRFGEQLHPALMRATRYIAENIGRKLSAPQIAEDSGLSHNQLNRLFHSQFGFSIMGYVWKHKMQQAKYLLESTDLPVKAISLGLGVDSLQHFNKLFHRHFQCPPSALRALDRPEIKNCNA